MRAMYHLVIVAMPEYEALDWGVLLSGGIRAPQGVPFLNSYFSKWSHSSEWST